MMYTRVFACVRDSLYVHCVCVVSIPVHVSSDCAVTTVFPLSLL